MQITPEIQPSPSGQLQIIPGIDHPTSDNHEPILDKYGHLKMSRLTDLDQPVIDITTPIDTPQPADLEVAPEPKPSIIRRAWNRANLLYANAPLATAQKVARFFTAESQDGEIKVRKGRLAMAVAGAAVVAAGVTYVKYKHGVSSGSKSDASQDVFDFKKFLPKRAHKGASSADMHQHLDQLATQSPPKPKSLRVMPGDTPWSVLERSGIKPTEIDSRLTQAAEKLRQHNGTQFSWHNYPSTGAWLKVGGKSDTTEVLKMLSPYL